MIEVAEFTSKLDAAKAPNDTRSTDWNPVPVMVTTVPPAVAPLDGETAVTVGTASAEKVNRSEGDRSLAPTESLTVTSVVAAAWAGDTASVSVPASSGRKETAGEPPKLTPVTPKKPAPSMSTSVPPDVLPVLGPTPSTVGATPLYVNWSAVVMALVDPP